MKMKQADSARLYGQIKAGQNTYIAQGTVIRSIDDSVSLGDNTWVLENSVVIGSPEQPVTIGQKTVFGHRCLVVGSTIGDLCEIGNSTIFLPGSVVGDRCIFGEGTIIGSDQVIPDESVVVGRPGCIIRRLSDDDRAMIRRMRGGDISLSDDQRHLVNEQGDKKMGTLYPYQDKMPRVADSVVLFDCAEITGDVEIGDNTIIASGVRIIGNSHGPVVIGRNVQILENSVLHLLPDNRLIIEDNVTIGPGCMIHGTTIGQGSVIEAGAIVCDYSQLGKNVLVKAGSLIKQRSRFDDDQIVEGFPAKVTGQNDGPLERPAWAIRQYR